MELKQKLYTAGEFEVWGYKHAPELVEILRLALRNIENLRSHKGNVTRQKLDSGYSHDAHSEIRLTQPMSLSVAYDLLQEIHTKLAGLKIEYPCYRRNYSLEELGVERS